MTICGHFSIIIYAFFLIQHGCLANMVFALDSKLKAIVTKSPIFILPYTIVVEYYAFPLECPSICPFAHPPVHHSALGFRSLTWTVFMDFIQIFHTHVYHGWIEC